MTTDQQKALIAFRHACDRALAVRHATEEHAHYAFTVNNAAALYADGAMDAAAFTTYAAACNAAENEYWRTVQKAGDECARLLQAAT